MLVYLWVALTSVSALPVIPWPGSNCVELGAAIGKSFEVSCTSWSIQRQVIGIIGDQGLYAFLGLDGSLKAVGNLGDTDLESCGFLSILPNIFFLGVESPPQLLLLDMDLGKITHKIALKGMDVSDSDGMEAIGFIPVTPTFAWIIAGSQNNGAIYSFPFNVSSPTNLPSQLTSVSEFVLSKSTDLAAIFYDVKRQTMWALYDKDNSLLVFNMTTPLSTTEAPKWKLGLIVEDIPGVGQEGFCLVKKATDMDAHQALLAQDRKDVVDGQLTLWDWPVVILQ